MADRICEKRSAGQYRLGKGSFFRNLRAHFICVKRFFDPDVEEEYSKLTQFREEPKVVHHLSPAAPEGLDLVFLASDAGISFESGRLASSRKFQAIDLSETFNADAQGQVMVRYYGLYANAQIHPSPGVDIRRGEAAAGPSLRASGPAGRRGKRGIRIAGDLESEGRTVIACPLSRSSGPTIRRRKLPPVGIWIIDTYPRPGYSYFVGGRVDSEPEAGAFMPREKRNFLSFQGHPGGEELRLTCAKNIEH